MLAAWAQVAVLIVTARFVWLYLRETEHLRKTAEEQVEVSQRQVTAAQDQLEGQIRPAIVIRHDTAGVALVLINVGKGPALHLRLSRTERGSAGKSGLDLMADEVGFIAAGDPPCPTPVRTQGAGVFALNGKSLQCEYTSLSGRTYWTVADFDKFDNDRQIATRLGEITG
jgi:hypothetical protein